VPAPQRKREKIDCSFKTIRRAYQRAMPRTKPELEKG